MSSLILKHADASGPSGEWSDDDFDVLADGVVVGRMAGRNVLDVDARFRAPRRPHADARLRGDARGRDDGVRKELAAGVRCVSLWRYSGSGPVCWA
jgi:hypothetical protein